MSTTTHSVPSELKIGTRLFLPNHGVATVLGLEERVFGSSRERFYTLGLARGDKLLLPVGNLDRAGARALVSKAKARQMLKAVRSAPETCAPTPWRKRATSYAEGLRSGSPDRYTEVLQGLLSRSRAVALSAPDRQMLEVARGYFVGEVGAVLGTPAHEIEADLAIEASGPRPARKSR